MAIFGWPTIEQAEEYVEAANREKLASDAIGPAGETTSARNFPTKTRVGKIEAKNPRISKVENEAGGPGRA